jgi:hypothetical protein
MDKIETTNKRILKFYNDNPSIHFEAINLIMIDLMEKLLNDMNSTMNSSIQSQILSTISEQGVQINELKSQISSLKDNLIIKFLDIKKEYIEDVKNIINTNTSEKISSLIEKNNDNLINKTISMVTEIIPRTHESLHKQIHETIISFQTSISADTNKLINSTNIDSLKEFMASFESKSSSMLQTVQQPIYAFLSASEERINSNITNLKDSANVNQVTQDKIFTELNDFLSKYKNSSYKGQFGENQLENVLNKIYPSGEIINTSGQSASCDFLLKRENKPTILFENKDYSRNANPEEVKKFIRDINERNQHGIFLSQNSGITTKHNFQIEFHKGCILVYVHNAEYSSEKIKLAVDIIDNLDVKIKELNLNEEEEETNNIITKELLDEINQEYQNFISQKDILLNVFKDYQKKILSTIEDLKFPNLDKYLSTKYASVKKQCYVCDICNIFEAPNKKSLSAHQRGCKKTIAPEPIIVETVTHLLETKKKSSK